MRLESQYFQETFDQLEKGKNPQSLVINKKFDEKCFTQVMQCFYGQGIQVSIDSLYQIYKICAFFKIDSLLQQLNSELLNNFHCINFYTLFQLAIQHKVESLVEKSEMFLHQNNDLLEEDPIIINTYLRQKYPSSFIDLIENTFALLMRIVLKLQAMTNLRAYDLIKLYCQHKYKQLTLGETQDKVKFLLENIYDKYSLDSNDYQIIFHNSIFQHQSKHESNKNDISSISNINYNTEVESQMLNMTMDKSNQNLIQMIMSENYIYKKQIQEFKDENKSLLGEMISLKKEIGETQINKTELTMIQEQQEDKMQIIHQEMTAQSQHQQKRIDTLEQELCSIKQYIGQQIQESSYRQQEKQGMNNNYMNNEMQSIDTQIDVKDSNMQQNHQISRLLEKDCMASITQDNESFDQFYQSHLDSVKQREYQKHKQREDNLRLQQQLQKQKQQQSQVEQVMITSSFFEGQEHNVRDSFSKVLQINESFINVTNNQKGGIGMGIMHTSEQRMVSPLSRSRKQKINQVKQIPLKGDDMQSINENLTLESFFISQKLNDQQPPQYKQETEIEIFLCNDQLSIDKRSEIININEEYYARLLCFMEVSLYQKARMRLIYRGSEDGFNHKALMKQTGNRKNLLSIISNDDESRIFGGYSCLCFQEAVRLQEEKMMFQKDNNSYVYSLTFNQKFPIREGQKSIGSDEESFLSYGNDIVINQNCHLDDNSISIFPEHYYVDPTQSFQDDFLTGSYNFQVHQIEIYQISIIDEMQI